MRTLLLILLGSGLLWIFLHRPTEDSPVDASAGQTAGEMLPLAQAPEGVSAPAAPPERTEDAAPESPAAPVVENRTPESPNPGHAPMDGSVASPPPGGSSFELEWAAVLLHDPKDGEEALERAGPRLDEHRREFLRTLVATVQGDRKRAAALAEFPEASRHLSPKEIEFLRAVGASTSPVDETRGITRGTPLLEATRLGMAAVEADAQLAARNHDGAARLFGELILAGVDATWSADDARTRRWVGGLVRAQAEYRWNPQGGWPAVEMRVEKGESLIGVRKRAISEHPTLRTCTGLIARANRLNSDVIQPNQKLRIPTEPVSVLVDLDAHRALYFLGDELVATWEVGVGREGKETRPGEYRVGDKRKDPMWFPRGQDPVPFGDPRNPLGSRWIELEDSNGMATHLGFHGTNAPESVGRDASEGCLRMRQEDVEELFEILPVGSPVVIRR